jgi:hypothetical protein
VGEAGGRLIAERMVRRVIPRKLGITKREGRLTGEKGGEDDSSSLKGALLRSE